jgi:formamidopyrimidine-DNA glycosylase
VPEILEVEQARAVLAEHALGRRVAGVHAPDAWYLKRGASAATVGAALGGRAFVAARRRGKLLLLDTDGGGPTLGLHLGMSGRVLVDVGDGQAVLEGGDPLVYASNRDVVEWRRFGVRFADGGAFYLRDPRRLGAVEIEPDEDRLGPDAFDLSADHLARILGRSKAPAKAVLMNQARVAGLGNLLVDESLYRGGIDPARTAATVTARSRARLLRAIRDTLRILGARGGSHTGDLPRVAGAPCPRDGAPLRRGRVAGRTTYWCPDHQT